MAMPGGEPTQTRPLVEHKEPAELLEPTERRRGKRRIRRFQRNNTDLHLH